MTWLGFLVQKKMASCVFKPDSIALIKTAKNKKSWLVYVAGSRHCRRKPGDKGIIAGHRKSSPMQMWSKAAVTDITSKASFYWWMVICFHDCVALLFQWQQFHECSYCVSVALCVALRFVAPLRDIQSVDQSMKSLKSDSSCACTRSWST